MTERTVHGFCERGECHRCDGVMRAATGWNWFCTHECHPEPVVRAEHQRALDFWRAHRKAS